MLEQSALAIFKLGFDPSLPCRELPSARAPRSCVYSEHFDKVLSVSDKNLPLWQVDGVADLAPVSIQQQRAVLSGTNLPQADRQQGAFRRSQRSLSKWNLLVFNLHPCVQRVTEWNQISKYSIPIKAVKTTTLAWCG